MIEATAAHELVNGLHKDVVGYCDPLSVRAGGEVSFFLSSYAPGPAQLRLVELISGDDRPHGTGLITREIPSDLPAQLDLNFQPLRPGSYAHLAGLPALDQGEISLYFYPTLALDRPQTLLCFDEAHRLDLSLDGIGLAALDLHIAMPIERQRWHKLTLRFDTEDTSLVIEKAPIGVAEQPLRWHAEVERGLNLVAGDWLLAAAAPGQQHFNGRLEGLAVRRGDTPIAEWDFGQAIHTQRIVDVVGDHAGTLHQIPTRGVKGRLWDGRFQNYADAPEQYGAIHFHDDDLTDAGWRPSVSLPLPADLPSGQYALHVVQGESEDFIPFFVRPAPGQRGSQLAYLVPTASYLAYANQRLGITPGIFGTERIRHANEAFLLAHEDVGFSLYEYHHDHSGVHFSSRLRPILNLKPQTGTWAFNADTHITAWLHATEQPFDVVTDEDLHLEGATALEGYRCVITGTHPEYYSDEMRDGLEAWMGDGGRLMYMGGNGFYWRIAYQPDNPGVIEVRRAEDGTRAWIAEPGEYYQQFDGRYGGLWRRQNKPPNQLVGIGFAAQGFDGGTYYRVQPGALDPRVAFIVDGLDADEIWGQFGNQGGGAAGEEIDRWDPNLGSPAHAVILATSENHKPGMLRVKEEFHMMEPTGAHPNNRADMVFFELPGGGAVFSTGSISYAGSLAHNGYDNEIARLTGNVLRRFLDATPFEMPG